MPTYDFRCDCGSGHEAFYTFAEFRRTDTCPACGGPAQLWIGTPRIQKSTLQHEARWDYNLGGVVSSQADRDELLKKRSDEAGKKLVWTDPGDMQSKEPDDGMDATRRTKTDTGEREGTTYL